MRDYRRIGFFVLLLTVAQFVSAQTITVRVLNGKNGHPIPNQTVTVQSFYKAKAGRRDRRSHCPNRYGWRGAVRSSFSPAATHLGGDHPSVRTLGLFVRAFC